MFDYDKLSKEDLIELIEDAMSRSKKYGLVWTDHPEELARKCKNYFPYLKEVPEYNINTVDVLQKKSPVIEDYIPGAHDKIKYHTPHILIEGDNYHSLAVLNYTHKGRIFLTYIDPPYNTGNEGWRYNDRVVDADDSFKHSKWLSSLSKRLRLHKPLMTEDGFIMISIDDNEEAQLKLMCDEVFGEQNFVGKISWHKGYGKNDSFFLRNITEYIIIYAKNIEVAKEGAPWLALKEGYESVKNLQDTYTNAADLQKQLRKFYKDNSHLKGIKPYNRVEPETLRVYRSVTMEDPKGSGYNYDVLHPNGKICKLPSKGWNRPESSMQELIEKNEVIFGKDETTLIQRKYYLDEMVNETPKDLIINSNQDVRMLKEMFDGKSPFDFPKPVSLIKELLLMTNRKDIIVLDSYAGSGTTGQAVLELNDDDSGNRQFILCTNDENGICTEVCQPRLEKVISGYTKHSNGEDVEGIPANLKYYRCDESCFVTVSGSLDQLKTDFAREGTEMLCLREGVYDKIEEEFENAEPLYRIFNHGNKFLCVFYDYMNEEGMQRFADKISKLKGKKIVYLFTLADEIYEEDLEEYGFFSDLEDTVVKPLPVEIVRTYKRLFHG